MSGSGRIDSMFDHLIPTGDGPLARAASALRAAVDELMTVELTGADNNELLAFARALEVEQRRLPAVGHRLIAVIGNRGIPAEAGCRNTDAFLRQLLRIAPAEATARVAHAELLGPRRSVLGEPLAPILERVAQAQQAGSLSDRHAQVIIRTLRELPDAVEAEHGEAVEKLLTEQAQILDPAELATAAHRIVATVHPDGAQPADAEHQRRRHASLRPNADGSADLTMHLTPSCRAKFQVLADSLAAPRPSGIEGPDPRTPGQRLHDAMEQIADRVLRAGELPPVGGLPVTLVITMTLNELEARAGLATTAHDGTMSIAEALQLATEAEVVPVIMNDVGGILNYGRGKRLASRGQRLVLAARDRGCSFPGCTAPPGWTEVHHTVDWVDGGKTDVAQMCLLCKYHHRHFEQCGWQVEMADGVPFWLPPSWIDPERKPLRNKVNQPVGVR